MCYNIINIERQEVKTMDKRRYYDDADYDEYEEAGAHSQSIRPVAPPPPAMSQESDKYLYQRERGMTAPARITVSDIDEDDMPRRNSKIAQRISNTKFVQNSYKLYEQSMKTKIIIFVGLIVFAIAFLIGAYVLLTN